MKKRSKNSIYAAFCETLKNKKGIDVSVASNEIEKTIIYAYCRLFDKIKEPVFPERFNHYAEYAYNAFRSTELEFALMRNDFNLAKSDCITDSLYDLAWCDYFKN